MASARASASAPRDHRRFPAPIGHDVLQEDFRSRVGGLMDQFQPLEVFDGPFGLDFNHRFECFRRKCVSGSVECDGYAASIRAEINPGAIVPRSGP
jgi:hypothetical protein